jgi:hypothetical protein
VAHHKDQLERRQQVRRERLELRLSEAQAAHAGIDLQRGRQALAAPSSEAGVAGELTGMVEDRDQPGGGDRVLGPGGQAVQDEDRGVRQARAERPALLDLRDEELAAAGLP